MANSNEFEAVQPLASGYGPASTEVRTREARERLDLQKPPAVAQSEEPIDMAFLSLTDDGVKLLDLPAELRVDIFEYYFDERRRLKREIGEPKPGSRLQPPTTDPLLLVSKQIHEEAAAVFYTTNSFFIDSWMYVSCFLDGPLELKIFKPQCRSQVANIWSNAPDAAAKSKANSFLARQESIFGAPFDKLAVSNPFRLMDDLDFRLVIKAAQPSQQRLQVGVCAETPEMILYMRLGRFSECDCGGECDSDCGTDCGSDIDDGDWMMEGKISLWDHNEGCPFKGDEGWIDLVKHEMHEVYDRFSRGLATVREGLKVMPLEFEDSKASYRK